MRCRKCPNGAFCSRCRETCPICESALVDGECPVEEALRWYMQFAQDVPPPSLDWRADYVRKLQTVMEASGYYG